MKNRVESEEVFAAYAIIDYGMWMLSQIDKRLDKRTPIERMVDKASGYNEKLERDAAEEMIPILEDVIEAKKVVQADYSKDELLLNAAKKIVQQ